MLARYLVVDKCDCFEETSLINLTANITGQIQLILQVSPDLFVGYMHNLETFIVVIND